MKIALLNYSGNVGKTTLARDLLKFRLPSYELITIESSNADGKEEVIIRGEDGDKLYTELLLSDDIILDIGSSNLEAFFKSNQKESEILSNIDKFIIPVTPELKQQQDTIKTIKDLLSNGIKVRQIYIIANQVIIDDFIKLSDVFDDLTSATKALKIDFNFKYAIERHDLYTNGKILAEMLSDEDYRAKMEEAKAQGDKENARILANKYIRQKKIQKLNEHYQMIFDEIFGKSHE